MKEIILEGLNERIYEHTTKSGLKVYMWVNERVTSTFMSLSVKYGSIHTKFKVGKKTFEVPNGVAHFLEHIKFNMDASTVAHDEFYKLGADSNAFTTFEYTSYIVYATKNLDKVLNLLLDYVYNPYFTKKMITKEKGIIIEEANMTEDDPYSVIFFDNLKSVLQKSNFREVITGTKEDIKEIELDDILNVYNNFYHPKNMFLTITGNINPYEMVRIIDEFMDKKTFKKYSEPTIITESEPKKVTSEYQEIRVGINDPQIKYSLKIPINKFKDIDLIDLKMAINLIMNINFGATSDFREELISKGLITSTSYYVDKYDEYIVITINASTNYSKEVIKRIQEKLENLNITDEDLTRKKNATIATMILDYEDIEGVNSKIQSDIINNGKIITDLKARVSNLDKETLEGVMKYINNDNVAVNVFLPKENQEG
jgi:predicted Zn-dependent peptidase